MSTTTEDRVTDATFLRPATTVLASSGRATRWQRKSGLQKLKWSAGATAVVGWSIQGCLTQPVPTLTVLGTAASYTAIVGVREAVRRALGGRDRVREDNIAKAMASRLGSAQGTVAREWVTYTRGRRGDPTTVTVKLPGDYDRDPVKAEKDAGVVARRAGFPDGGYEYELDETRDPPLMVVREVKLPPEKVLLADVRPYMEQAGNGRYFIGLGIDAAPIWGDLNGDGPHWVWSQGTGAGKTTAVRNIAAQVRREGGRVIIFDCVKMDHADWIYDEHGRLLPGIEHYDTVESVFYGLQAVAEERMRRSREATRAKQFRQPEPDFPRILVVLEEQNATADMLNDYWKLVRKDLGFTASHPNPAMAAIKALIFAGRSAKMHAFVACQRFDANIIGGGSVRGNFMVRVLARFDADMVRMLIKDIKPVPASSNWLGRAVVCMEGKATPVQGVWMTPDEARDWAVGSPAESGRTFDVLDLSAVSTASTEDASPSADLHEDPDESDLATVTALKMGPVTLREAEQLGVVKATHRAMTNARQRARERQDGSFPEPVDTTEKQWRYARTDLKAWEAGRVGDVAEMDDEEVGAGAGRDA